LEGLQTSIKLHLDKLDGLNHEVNYHTKVVRGLDQCAQLGTSSYHNTCKYENIDYNKTKVEQALVAIQAIVESIQIPFQECFTTYKLGIMYMMY